jgi:hypothetical protein
MVGLTLLLEIVEQREIGRTIFTNLVVKVFILLDNVNVENVCDQFRVFDSLFVNFAGQQKIVAFGQAQATDLFKHFGHVFKVFFVLFDIDALVFDLLEDVEKFFHDCELE